MAEISVHTGVARIREKSEEGPIEGFIVKDEKGISILFIPHDVVYIGIVYKAYDCLMMDTRNSVGSLNLRVLGDNNGISSWND